MDLKDKNSRAANELVIIVNRKNRPIGISPRHKMRREGLIHSATYILVLNAARQLFMPLMIL
jgi:hypothetical protein